jgi:AAA+ superfamily predicted ATPase
MEKTLKPWATWEPCEDGRAAEVLTRLAGQAPQFFADSSLVEARCAKLSFYATHRLLELTFVRSYGPEIAFVLDGSGETRWLDGSSLPIHQTNAAESLALTDATVQDYLRFFLYFLRSTEGAFTLIESPAEITAAGHDDAWFEQYRDKVDFDAARLWLRLQAVRSRVVPPKTRHTDESGRWLIDGTVAYGGHLFLATFAVAPNGLVEMVDDNPVETLEGLSAPECPSLELESNPEALIEPDEGEEAETPPLAPSETGETSRKILSGSAELPRDRAVTEAAVAVLLEDAIRERDSTMLLRHFNAETAADQPIDRLRRLMVGSVPIIIIESDIPFVEDFVAGLIVGPDEVATGGAVARANPLDGDDMRSSVAYRNDAIKLHLLSFHAYRGLFDAERTAHELAIRDASVLIGCDRRGDVPEPLRRVTDLVLTFPRIDRRLFARIFERVFHTKAAPGWDAPGTDWTRYLVPADFHTPRRLNLSPDQALAFLKERVETRLRQVTPDIGPSLSELHGMGEARQISEDLIADIRAAQAGEIPWTAVDKGLLLVGAPGTGKTTLARAIAKACGIKFVVASAAKWQSAGYLDAHLRAMRSDFVEARRYAPAILFLDELDSIGNREQLTGPATQYQTEVINALLEQVQGIETSDAVVVIAATNYLDKIDPALRRAGRLDQVVQIPLPNIASLEEIFRYYLKPHRADSQVAADVHERTLAELAFGLTGADVEFFVRGAARRARRERRPIAQVDLLAEVTRRPRRSDSAPRLGPDEMRRVAVHEAGHTLARLVSSTRGDDITFVTIVPRTDGTLGFVASVPQEGAVLTRRTMLEELETVLAGRAAEEVAYGAENVGLGAGGSSARSDLAVATRLATSLVCQSGLGDDGALQWTESPTPAQERQIEALLRKAYSGIVARIQSQRGLFDRIADALVAKQELSGTELRHLLALGTGGPPSSPPLSSSPAPRPSDGVPTPEKVASSSA